MNEMKPEDVMRALEICVNGACCNECPYFKRENCATKLHQDALSLLRLREDLIKMCEEELAEKDAEIERLTTLARLGNMRANDYRAMRDKAKAARAEAITEFAEKLKYTLCIHNEENTDFLIMRTPLKRLTKSQRK